MILDQQYQISSSSSTLLSSQLQICTNSFELRLLISSILPTHDFVVPAITLICQYLDLFDAGTAVILRCRLPVGSIDFQ